DLQGRPEECGRPQGTGKDGGEEDRKGRGKGPCEGSGQHDRRGACQGRQDSHEEDAGEKGGQPGRHTGGEEDRRPQGRYRPVAAPAAARHPPAAATGPRPRALPSHPIPPAARNTRNHAMAVKIDKKITGYAVVAPEDKDKPVAGASVPREKAEAELPRKADIIHMHERIERPEVLIGSTYKIKSPLVEHAMYVTINDIVLNAGNEHEHRRPFEIFINSKSMEHFQWI